MDEDGRKILAISGRVIRHRPNIELDNVTSCPPLFAITPVPRLALDVFKPTDSNLGYYIHPLPATRFRVIILLAFAGDFVSVEFGIYWG